MTTSLTKPTLHIFARWPEPGKAKTRLIPALGAEGATRVYRKLLEHTVRVARTSGLPLELRISGGEPEQFREWLGDHLTITEQGYGDLGAKLGRASAPGIVIGSDAPGLTAELLQQAAEALEDNSAVIGPADDGGYYLLGFREPAPFAFADMKWSTEKVFAETMARFAAQGIAPKVLPELTDVDTADDLAKFPDFML